MWLSTGQRDAQAGLGSARAVGQEQKAVCDSLEANPYWGPKFGTDFLFVFREEVLFTRHFWDENGFTRQILIAEPIWAARFFVFFSTTFWNRGVC